MTMSTSQSKNAIISSTYIGIEDHGIPTAYVYLQFDGAGQGFGGYDLRTHGLEFIMSIITALEVPSWEKLPGTPCRVVGDSSKLIAIGHFYKNQWYYPDRKDI